MIYFICAGKGSRMKSKIPKALQKVNGVPNVLRNANIVRELNQDFRIVINHDSKNDFLEYFSEEELIGINSGFGSGHAVMLLNLKDDDLIIWGDAVINDPGIIIEAIESKFVKRSPLLIALKAVKNPYVSFDITSDGRISEVRFSKYGETSNSGYQDCCVFKVKKSLTKHLKNIHDAIWKNRYISESQEFEFLYVVHYLHNIGKSSEFYISSFPDGISSYNTKEELEELNYRTQEI